MTILITTATEYNFPLPYLNIGDIHSRKTPFYFFYGRYCQVETANNHVRFIGVYPGSAEELLDIVKNSVYTNVILNIDSKKIMYDLDTHTLINNADFSYSPKSVLTSDNVLIVDGDGNLYKLYSTNNPAICAYAHNLANRFETYKITELGKFIFLEMIAMIYKMDLNSPEYVVDKFIPKTEQVYYLPKKNTSALDKLVLKLDGKLKEEEDKKYKFIKPEDLVQHGTMLLSDFISFDDIPSWSSTVYLDDDLLILPKNTIVYFANKKFWIKYKEPNPPLTLIQYKDLLRLDASVQVNLIRDTVGQFNFGEGFSEYREGD
jgi:hypothetical protein